MATIPTSQEERTPVKQIEQSKSAVYEKFDQINEELSSIVQKQLAVSHARTVDFKTHRSKLDEDLQGINQEVAEGMSQLEQNWQDLLEVQTPLDMEDELQKLKSQCDEVLSKKREIIDELEKEITRRDHEYVNTTAEQNAQIDTFVRQLRTSLASVQKQISTELETILGSIEQERTSLSLLLTKESKQFEAQRQKSEQALMKKIKKYSDQQRDTLEEMRRNNAQEYSIMRTSMETRLESFQKEHEDAQARYLFSLEQLDYETRILADTQDEHEEKVKLQNKKIVRQRDILRALKQKYNEEDKRFTAENRQITQEYTKITENYRQLQERFRKVAYADFNTYREVWNLNEKRLHELVMKIIDANRIIIEQQLGFPMQPPGEDIGKRLIIGTEAYEDLTRTPQAPQETPEEITAKMAGSTLLHGKTFSEPLEHLWHLISDEVGFLVEERVKNLLGLDENEDIETSQVMISRDLLLQDLGITTNEDVEQLLSYFLRDIEFGELETPGFVRPHEVLEGLKKFVESYHPTVQTTQTNLFAQISSDPTQNTSSEVARAIVQLQGKMNKQMAGQREFITNKSTVVTEEMWRIWTACFKAMELYLKELEERAKLIEETERLTQQNREIEMILTQYIESDANDSLIYAPAETVDFYQQ